VAVEKYLKIIRQGVAVWNDWREKNPLARETDLSGANFREDNLKRVDFSEVNLRRADLSEANLKRANLYRANLSKAKLTRADLSGANLNRANLTGADLTGAKLRVAQLIQTDLRNTTLTGSYVYGASVWGVKLNDRTEQQNLIITQFNEPVITVDNIKVAQFIYLLLNNQEIRDVIDTITSKAVLILGRFSEERKSILDAIRHELRKPEHNYLPIMFDFQPLTSRTTVETLKTLASMARFVIADLTDARSVLQELEAIVPAFPSLAVRLLLKKSEHEHGMMDTIRLYRSVVENTYEYENLEGVIASIKENIILPAESKVKELRQRNRM